jgi:DNA polymerase III subunit alpha
MKFASLHHHTTLSYQDGFRPPEEHVAACVELGYVGLAVTEHGNVSSHIKVEKAAQGTGLRTGFGCELYCDTGDERGQLKNHLTVIAETPEGYRNLLQLVSASWENFRYKPTTTSALLQEHSAGLFALSGCLGGLLATALWGGKGTPEKSRADRVAGRRVIRWFQHVFGDRYYLEVMPHPTLPRQRAHNAVLGELGAEMGVPLVATLDCHYPSLADQEMYPVLHAIDRGGRNNTVEAQSQSWEYDIVLAPRPPREIFTALVATGLSRFQAAQAMAATVEISERWTASIPKFLDLRFPGRQPSDTLIRQWCRDGWVYRGFGRLSAAERHRYGQRVQYELELIIEKGYTDYFLVIADLVQWAKKESIAVGPARGSAAASLVCYLLRITEVNPMVFPTLLIERFIDPNRHDLPDIDLDFDDEQRPRIRHYLVDQYGAERVGNIGTFVQYKGKNSLDDIARVFRVPVGTVTAVKEMIIERSSGDLRAATTIEDSIAMFPKVAAIFDQEPNLRLAQRLEGNVKGMSVHAAGLVVAEQPLTDSVAVYTRLDSKTGERATVLSIDKYDAEYINALKIDALGLTTMGVIRRCLDMIGMDLEELYRLPLDDETVFAAFRENRVVGIFQFDGRAMKSVNREVKPETFMELCDINALSRPGPLHSGAAAEYIQVKHRRKPATRFNAVVDEITVHTQYQIVYQEQILQVVRRLGNFTWEQAAAIRKLISKKQGEQAFNRMQRLFVTGCAANGVDELTALRIWKLLVTAGAYAFNAAHCVSYGMLAYWTMWLKVHHPLAFYCAALQRYDPKTKGFDLLKEAQAAGIDILPPDPQHSAVTWTVAEGRLVAGFTQVPGIGLKTAQSMAEYRPLFRRTVGRRGIKWEDYLAVRGIGPGTLMKIEQFVADPDPFGLKLLSQTLVAIRRWLRQHAEENFMRVPTSRSEDVPYEPRPGEHVWVGVVRERNLKDLYELHRSRTGEELDPATVKDPDFVNWCVVTGEDETGPVTLTVHRYGGLYEKYKDVLWGLDPAKQVLLVRGFKKKEYRRALMVRELWVLNAQDYAISSSEKG